MRSGEQDYVFEQFRVGSGCLVADPETRQAALVDPEMEMVEAKLDAVFGHCLKVVCVADDLLVFPGHDHEGREHSVLGEEEFVRYMEREDPETLTPVYRLADALKANTA